MSLSRRELLKQSALAAVVAQLEAEGQGTLGSGSDHPVESLFEDVFAELPWHLKEQQQAAVAESRP